MLVEIIHDGNLTLEDLGSILKGVMTMNANTEVEDHKTAMHQALLRAAIDMMGKIRGNMRSELGGESGTGGSQEGDQTRGAKQQATSAGIGSGQGNQDVCSQGQAQSTESSPARVRAQRGEESGSQGRMRREPKARG